MSKTMRRYSTCDKINAIVKNLIKQGWELIIGNRHPKLRSPDGKATLVIPKTPSDRRATLNWISQARQAGAPV